MNSKKKTIYRKSIEYWVMTESIFQTLLVLAYFDIALISITIANYAVSASILGRESRLSRWRMEKRKKRLEEKVKELQTKGLPIDELNKETKECQADLDNIRFRIFLLSYLGAVILPLIPFAASLVLSVIGMNADILSQDLNEQAAIQQGYILSSSAALVSGFILLLLVIAAIDSAARRLPIPQFDVSFQGDNKIEFKRKEKKSFLLDIRNIGEDVADQLQIFIIVPNVFKVGKGDHIISEATENFPDCTQMMFKRDSLHIDVTMHHTIELTAPDLKKTYEVVVFINERKTLETNYRLAIEVVD
jgi:hypothetical protein